MESNDYAKRILDIKNEIVEEIRKLVPEDSAHRFSDKFYVRYIEGEVATTEVCSAVEVWCGGMVVFIVNHLKEFAKEEVIEGEAIYRYEPDSFLDILDHLKKEVREKKFQILRKLLNDNGGCVKIDSQTVIGILGEREEYPCIVEELHLKDGKIEILDNYEGDKFTNSEAELTTQSIDRLIDSVRKQTYRQFVVRVSGSFSRTFDINASSFEEALALAKKQWEETPLYSGDSNGEDWDDYTDYPH